MVYKGGDTIDGQNPSFHFPVHGPRNSVIRKQIFPIGNFSGRGYPSILITDHNGSYDKDIRTAVIFVFNTQKGLSDTCKAYAAIQYGDDEGFGEQAICMGDLFGNGITSIMIGQNNAEEPGIILDGQGAITIFNGDLSYGWPVSGVLQTLSRNRLFSILRRIIRIHFHLQRRLSSKLSSRGCTARNFH